MRRGLFEEVVVVAFGVAGKSGGWLAGWLGRFDAYVEES